MATERLRPADSFDGDGAGARFLEERGHRGIGALGSAAATVGELLVEFPASEQVVTTSAGSVAAMEFAAREQFTARGRGDAATYAEHDSSALLRCRVVSVLEGQGELVTDNGERFRIVTHGRLHPGDEGWVAVRAQWAAATGMLFFVRGWTAGTRPLTVRCYDASLARSFARGLVMPEIIEALDLSGADEQSRSLAASLLTELHGLSGPRLLLTEGAAGVTEQLCAALTAFDPSGGAAALDLAGIWTVATSPVDDRAPGFDPARIVAAHPAHAVQAASPAEEPATTVLVEAPRETEPAHRAIAHLRQLGFPGAAERRWGADGGTELVSATADAMVAGDDLPDQERAMQALVGIATLNRRVPVFYSTNRFTIEALEWADRGSVACFELAADGVVTARSLAALDLQRSAASAAPQVVLEPSTTPLGKHALSA